MSVALSFKHPRAFPFCLPDYSTTIPYADYVDTTLELAMGFWWNLENFEIVVTGDGYFYITSLDMTLTFGSTASLPFGPDTGWPLGSYYGGTIPAKEPYKRVCISDDSTKNYPLSIYGSEYIGPVGIEDYRVYEMAFALGSSGDPALPVRIYYSYNFRCGNTQNSATTGVFSPEFWTGISPTGSPSTSGTMTIAGIDFPWVGGEMDFSIPEWINTRTASIDSCTTSLFTY